MPDEDEQAATLDDVLGRLKLITYDLTSLRRNMAIIVIIAAVQLALLGLWLFGGITVEFKPVR